jgi:hypothetical protein
MSSGRYYINDSIFHLLTLEAINYIMNKNIEQKQKAIVNYKNDYLNSNKEIKIINILIGN